MSLYSVAAKACTGKLVCQECQKETQCTEKNAESYLRSGWPKCCGYTMRLVTGNELNVAGDQQT